MGVQIRQSVASSLAQTNQLAHESLAIVSLEVAKDADLASLLEKGLGHFEQMSESERFRFIIFMVTIFRRYENVFYQFKKGLLEPELWVGYRQSMLLYFHTDGGREFWKLRHLHYSKLFQDFLNSTSADDVQSVLTR